MKSFFLESEHVLLTRSAEKKVYSVMDFIDGPRDEAGNIILKRRIGSFEDDVISTGKFWNQL